MWWFLWIVLVVFMAVVMWMIFTKAGRAGWKAIIPFYNTYVLLEIAGKPGWWLVFFFIPIVNIVFWVILYVALGGVFSRGTGFTVGLVFLPIIFLPIMAFDSSKYTAPATT